MGRSRATARQTNGYEMAKATPTATQTPPKAVRFTNTESPHLQTIYVDGVTGSITPRNVLRATFFEESYQVPATEDHELVHQGGTTFGVDQKTSVVDPDGVVNIARESKVTLILSRKGLAQLIPWLGEKLAELEAAESEDRGRGPRT